jgi:hypothetical protein
MATVGALLGLAGFVGIVVGGVNLIRPERRLHIPTRRVAGIVAGASFLILIIGLAVTPAKDKGDAKSDVSTVDANAPTTRVEEKTIEQRIEESIRDNKNAVKDGSNLDGLALQFDEATGRLAVSIKPNNPAKLTQFLTNGSALAIIVGKVVWSTYPQVNIISLNALRDMKDSSGKDHTEDVVFAEYTRDTGEKYNYYNLWDQPSSDNKTMFCSASFYQISVELWRSLGDKGCMKTYAGGVDPTEDQNVLIVSAKAALPTPTPAATPTPAPTRDGAVYIDPRLIVSDPNAYKGRNVLLQGKALNVDQKSDYTWINVLAEVRDRDTNESMVVEFRPKRSNVLSEECYRFYGVVEGTRKVRIVLTGAEKEIPLVRGYDLEDAPRGKSGFGCAAP